MGDWHVGDPVGFGNDIGSPEVAYMGYVRRDRQKDKTRYHNPKEENWKARRLARKALKLNDEGEFDAALIFIDQALEIYEKDEYVLNVKATILHTLGLYDMALEYYDRSLKIKNTKTVMADKAECLFRIAGMRYISKRYSDALEYINQALEVIPNDYGYLKLKGDILNCLGRHEEASKCYSLCEDKTEGNKIWVCITGTRHYKGTEVFKRGMVVELFEEAGNDYDPDAVRVEIVGETVGYIANSPKTLYNDVKSATQISKLFKNKIEAQILGFRGNDVIAELII